MQGSIMHMMRILQTMIDCQDVSKDIIAWEYTNEALQIARVVSKENASNTKGGRHVCDKHSSLSG